MTFFSSQEHYNYLEVLVVKKAIDENNKKEVDAMSTAVKLRAAEVEFIKEMDNYVLRLKKQQIESSENAYNEAKSALLRTGVITKSGKTKKKIVSWE